jgi:amidase
LNPVHTFRDDALGDLDGVGLKDALKARRVSVREVVEAAIARTEAVNPVLNGLAYEAFDRARKSANAARPYQGFFGGVPTFIKDNVAVAGMPKMMGTDGWEPRPAEADGDFVRSYLATGMIPLGLTRMSEFGFNPAAEHPRLGAVRNPWHPDYTAGGSSSGSGAFVGAGVVPIAHANDGGGSTRIVASCNGLVGLKPSRGRLPVDKELRLLPIKIVENGVLTRSVRDTAAFYRVTEQLQPNPKLPAIGDVTAPGKARLRIAVCTRSVAGECSPEIRELTLKTAALLEELGHHVEHLDAAPLPSCFADDFLLYWSLLAMALARASRPVVGAVVDRGKLDNLTLGLARHGSRNLHRMPLAIARLASMRRVTARLYRTYDVVLTPTLAHNTPRIGHLDPTADYRQIIDRVAEWIGFTPPHNATGEPAISLPAAETAAGLPHGMMLAAAVGQDARLLELAYELEEAQPWRRIQFS